MMKDIGSSESAELDLDHGDEGYCACKNFGPLYA